MSNFEILCIKKSANVTIVENQGVARLVHAIKAGKKYKFFVECETVGGNRFEVDFQSLVFRRETLTWECVREAPTPARKWKLELPCH